jgi:hypothetical protein
MMVNQVWMNLRRPMIIFLEIFDEDSLLHGYGKRTEQVRKTFRNCCLWVISSQTRIRLWTFVWYWLSPKTYITTIELKCKQLPKCSYSKLIEHSVSSTHLDIFDVLMAYDLYWIRNFHISRLHWTMWECYPDVKILSTMLDAARLRMFIKYIHCWAWKDHNISISRGAEPLLDGMKESSVCFIFPIVTR